MSRLVRAELLKIRTTNTWWIFLLAFFLITAGVLAIWILVANATIDNAVSLANEQFMPPPPDSGMSPAEIEEARRQFERDRDIDRTLVTQAANIYTSGQYFGLMFVMLLGTLLMTNEFYHQTATATFLTTPHRTRVILGKLGVAMLAAGFFWVSATVMNLAAGAIFFSAKGYSTQLGEWPVTRAVLLNGLAFVLWGVLGVGIGVLIRSQIGAVVTGTVAYVVGTFVVTTIFQLLYFGLNWKWVLYPMVLWPGVASSVMISAEGPFGDDSPEWWVGALVLVGYGILFGLVGTLITRRRDIS